MSGDISNHTLFYFFALFKTQHLFGCLLIVLLGKLQILQELRVHLK